MILYFHRLTFRLTISFMNFIVMEIHVISKHNFVTYYPIILPSMQRFHFAKKKIHLNQHESPTTLHC